MNTLHYFSYNGSVKTVKLMRGSDPSWTPQEKMILAAKMSSGIDESVAVKELYDGRYAPDKIIIDIPGSMANNKE